jgi:hypothetical protein
MRAWWLILLGACSPTIAPGAYLCGAEQSCPPDQACDGVTDSCTLKGTEMPFTCADGTDFVGDDSAATARPIPALGCVSPPFPTEGCMPSGDSQDWMKLTVPSTCTSVEVQIRLSFPVAYEKLGLELWDLDANISVGTDVPCVASANDPARLDRCIELPVTPGKNYGVMVKSTSDGNCGGACAYNRYELSVQLATPG